MRIQRRKVVGVMKQLSIEIIQKCPNRCLHCSSFSGSNCETKISTEMVKKVIDSAYKLDAEILSISGGEPFLHEGLLDIVRYAKQNNITTYIYTSGIKYDDVGNPCSINFEEFQELHNLSVDKIIFDIPAITEKIYDKFMGTCDNQKFAIESLVRSKQSGIYTEIHFVPTKINVDEIDNILSFSDKYKVDQVSFLGLVPHGRALENSNELLLSEQENEALKIKLDGLSFDKKRIGIPLQRNHHNNCNCYAGKNKLCVRYDGMVFGCEAFKYIQLFDDNGNIITPDSIYNRSLDDIFRNSEYLKAEKKYIEHQMAELGCSDKCPVQRSIRKTIDGKQ